MDLLRKFLGGDAKRVVQEPERVIETHECSICKKPAILTRRINDISPFESPSCILINQIDIEDIPREDVEALGPHVMHFCIECSDMVTGYIIFLISEREKEKKEQEISERLSNLKAGTVLTMVDDKPEPLPNPNVRQMLSHTPFSGIFDIDQEGNED